MSCKDNCYSKYINHFINEIDKGPLKDFYNKKYDENNKYFDAVRQGYLDACRTITGGGTMFEKTENNVGVLSTLAAKLKGIIEAKTVNEETIKDCIEELSNSSGITIGQAQKIVNMSYKYLFCFDFFFDKDISRYDNCHMPLDKYTLNWCIRVGIIDKKIEWSKISTYSDYADVQEKIKDKLISHVLKKEFLVWEIEKIKEANEEMQKLQMTIEESSYQPDKISDNSESIILKQLGF